MTEIAVLGAGMVGICTALELQSRGHDVTVVDRATPGSETSFGNAGIIQAEAAEPYHLPRDIVTLLRIALGQTNDVTWSLSGLISMYPALQQYFRYSSAKSHAEISRHYAKLTTRSTVCHEPLIHAAGAEYLIAKTGLSCVYRNRRQLDRDASDLERLKNQYGVESRVLDGEEYRGEEPALTNAIAGAIHWSQSWSCTNPGLLTQKYVDLFIQRGGHVLEQSIEWLQQRGTAWIVEGVGGMRLETEGVVVSLGPWSPQILSSLEYRIPMIYKRGYHAQFSGTAQLNRPFLDVDNGVVALSVEQGLRVTSGVALVGLDAKANHRQLNRGVSGLSEIINLGSRTDEPVWFGTRPCLPDMLPLVGAAPHHHNLWFNFGHGHQGFTMGPSTAICVADAIDGNNMGLLSALSPVNRVK